MKTRDIEKLYKEYILPTYTQTPLCIAKGKGSKVWDLEGKEYLDFFPGWAVSALGHCHPKIVSALKIQAKKVIHIPNNFLNLKQAQLAREISKNAFPCRIFFCNSGAEASEAAIKFSRKFGNPTGRFEIISMRKSFHGRTMGAMTATGQERIHKGFDPLPAGFRYADFNDLASVKSQLTDKTVAIFLEPIQGEGGVQIAEPEFLQGLRNLCDARKLLLIFDEVQTGMGRTGKMFAYQNYDRVEPDLMTLAKALGGGVPIGALAVNNKIIEPIFTPGSHGSTYGGNPLVCAAALAVFETIKKDKLLTNAARMGTYLQHRLGELKDKYDIVSEVRGLGLMCALELRVPGAPFVDAARSKGLLVNCTQEKTLRIMPAITVTKRLIDSAIRILDEVLAEANKEVEA